MNREVRGVILKNIAGVLSDYLDYRDAADWLDQEFIVRV